MAKTHHFLLLFVLCTHGTYAKNSLGENVHGISGLAALHLKLNGEKGMKDEDQQYASLPRLETNFTVGSRRGTTTQFGGVNMEQIHNRRNDKVRQLYAFKNAEQEVPITYHGVECTFEKECNWTWEERGTAGFFVTSAERYNATDSGPSQDATGHEKGHFLILRLNAKVTEPHITSPLFSPSEDSCRLQVWIYQEGMVNGMIRIIAETINQTQWVVSKILGDDRKKWIKYEEAVGRISQEFNIQLEVVGPSSSDKSTVAFDNLKLTDCFPESESVNGCTPYQYRCAGNGKCINITRICDITQDCPLADDENKNCDKVPYGARCNFEQDTCGWINDEDKVLKWERHNGSTPTNRTGPNVDHTYGDTLGKYMYVNMAMQTRFASMAILESVVFNPPPKVHGNVSSKYYNSCTIRFYLHKFGSHKSGLKLLVTELTSKQTEPIEVFWSFNDYGDNWMRIQVLLPNITHKYFLQFQASRGIRYRSDVAIDDFSMSPECFGINIPSSELQGYDYWNPDIEKPSDHATHESFINQTYYEITTCNATGRYGPTQENCTNAYNGTVTSTKVLHAPGLNGVQKWTVPSEGYYTIILLGASGGKGSVGIGSSRGAMVRIVVELRKGQELLFLIGQEGSPACVKSLVSNENSSCKSLLNPDSNNLSGVRGVLAMEVGDGGGGGGGATFAFFHNRSRQPVPLAVAAGGGGLGLGRFTDTGGQHGQGINHSRSSLSGEMYGNKPSGAGGGWEISSGVPIGQERLIGLPLTQGSLGGQACYDSDQGKGDGGYGGGGGGCINGGGGGGYAGGNSWTPNSTNGEGGYSFLDSSRPLVKFSEVRAAFHDGPGAAIIIPAVPGCECDYRCLALDAQRSQTACICPNNWKLDENGKSCLLLETTEENLDWLIAILGIFAILACIVFGFGCFIMYSRYQHRAVGVLRRKMLSGPDLQLNRLRGASDNMITEYNPNYEFGGVVYTVKDLKDIPRNQLQLQKALGQGAFGEVYQGFYRQRSGDAIEMPVAVKTLPAMSTEQSEIDFLMEALIMSKFNHPNIVHFIGVCFDKHPRFIVLELLAGGDLKNFLRESRPKPDKGSTLTMKDMVTMSIDVAKGCRYLEENRFIHRDIAARNCLLTTKGPGRVVKIADFGMSRDIYRSDYYRKGGRAMLPIKWMPPEAFLDGIFTSKTDVWSFGVLLWETMSMGYMPYTGCANRQVMQLVTSGGRLEPPANCPGPIYGIMTQCWHPDPEQRPNFGQILERLGYCAQDPDVMNAPLPVFNRPASQEKDATIMRPDNDENCLEVPKATDYLIPNNVTSAHVDGSSSSVDRLLPENSADSWETSFVIPQSKSTQPLLPEGGGPGDATKTTDKLLIPDGSPTEKLPPKVSPISLPNNILANHNKEKVTSLRAGVSLDAGALAKQSNMSPLSKKSYMNINPEEKLTGNGIIPNGPCASPNKNAYMNSNKPNAAYLNETITC